jgi:hypothetical protein
MNASAYSDENIYKLSETEMKKKKKKEREKKIEMPFFSFFFQLNISSSFLLHRIEGNNR